MATALPQFRRHAIAANKALKNVGMRLCVNAFFA